MYKHLDTNTGKVVVINLANARSVTVSPGNGTYILSITNADGSVTNYGDGTTATTWNKIVAAAA